MVCIWAIKSRIRTVGHTAHMGNETHKIFWQENLKKETTWKAEVQMT